MLSSILSLSLSHIYSLFNPVFFKKDIRLGKEKQQIQKTNKKEEKQKKK